MQIIDCVQAMTRIHRLPRNEVAYLQDSHCVDGDEDDPFDEQEDEYEGLDIINEEEFFDRYVD